MSKRPIHKKIPNTQLKVKFVLKDFGDSLSNDYEVIEGC